MPQIDFEPLSEPTSKVDFEPLDQSTKASRIDFQPLEESKPPKSPTPASDKALAETPVSPASTFSFKTPQQMDVADQKMIAPYLADAATGVAQGVGDIIPKSVGQAAKMLFYTPVEETPHALKEAYDVIRGVPIEQAVPESQTYKGFTQKPLTEQAKIVTGQVVPLALGLTGLRESLRPTVGGELNAKPISETAPIHESLLDTGRPQEGAGQMPAPESGLGVQTRGQGQVVAPETQKTSQPVIPGDLWYQGVSAEGGTPWVTHDINIARSYALRRGPNAKINVYTPEQVGETAFADTEGNLMSPQEYAKTNWSTTIQTGGKPLPKPIEVLPVSSEAKTPTGTSVSTPKPEPPQETPQPIAAKPEAQPQGQPSQETSGVPSDVKSQKWYEEYYGEPAKHASAVRATESGSLLDADGNEIKPGDQIKLHFMGGPADMPEPWTLESATNKFSSVNYKLNPSVTVKAANGTVRTYDWANQYSPRKGAPVPEGGQTATVSGGKQEPPAAPALTSPESADVGAVPVVADEPHVSAIANRFIKERADRGELGQITLGRGFSRDDLVFQGLKMPPEEINQHVSDLMQGTGDIVKQGQAVRVEEARLTQRSNKLSKVADADPKNVEARLAADNAFKDLEDFHNGPVAQLKQKWHATGLEMQGEIPVDLSTYNGLRQQWLRDVGEAPPAKVEPELRRTAQNVSKAIEEDNGARSKLSQAIDKESTRRKYPTADEVRNNIRERMGLEPCRI